MDAAPAQTQTVAPTHVLCFDSLRDDLLKAQCHFVREGKLVKVACACMSACRLLGDSLLSLHNRSSVVVYVCVFGCAFGCSSVLEWYDRVSCALNVGMGVVSSMGTRARNNITFAATHRLTRKAAEKCAGHPSLQHPSSLHIFVSHIYRHRRQPAYLTLHSLTPSSILTFWRCVDIYSCFQTPWWSPVAFGFLMGENTRTNTSLWG